MITGKKFGCFVLSFIHLFIFSTSLLEYNCVTLCWFLLYNKVNQLYIYIHPHYPPSCISLPPSLSHPSRRSQSTQLISLCYAAASHQLPILRLVVYICPCHSLTSSQLTLPSPRVLKSILYVCVVIPLQRLLLGMDTSFYAPTPSRKSEHYCFHCLLFPALVFTCSD